MPAVIRLFHLVDQRGEAGKKRGFSDQNSPSRRPAAPPTSPPFPTNPNPRLFSLSFAELHLTFAHRQCDERCHTVDTGCRRPARRQ